jgi:hypothetical protein
VRAIEGMLGHKSEAMTLDGHGHLFERDLNAS